MAMPASHAPASILPGATDLGNDCVTFALYAPGKHSVSLIGDFNNWDRHADPMNPKPDGLWWTQKYLKSGNYTYQFAVDVDEPAGEIVICDPYARELAEDSAFDLPRAIVEVGQARFEWQHDDWPRPAFEDLVLMEIHIGDFTPEGTLSGLMERLDYLRDLGINAIELMPVYEFKSDLGWGYNPAYLFTVEKSYGTAEELRRLVDQAHSRGIAVVLDMVLAHTAHRHPFNKLYQYQDSPWYGPGCGEVNQFGFPSLDYKKKLTQVFSRDVQNYWLHEFHVDGFRYDYCVGIGCLGPLGMPHLVAAARAECPGVYLIGEYSPENTEQVNASALDGAWHVGGSYAIKALLCEDGCGTFDWDDFDRCLSVLDPWDYGYETASQMINFLESHDEQRTINDMYSCGQDQATAFRKATLGATILFTMPGEPMLYHGQEFGEGTPRKTNERNTLHWEALDEPGGRELHDHYQKLAALRRDHPALRSETYQLDAAYPEQKAAVYHRWNDDGDQVVVAANFSAEPQTIAVPFPQPARWRDAIGGQEMDADGPADVELAPGSALVFVKA